MIKASEFKKRRENLFKKIDENSIVILFSGLSKKSTGDENYPFVVNSNFYYLTNVIQEESILVLVKSNSKCKEFLFVSPRDETKEKWTGKLLAIDEAKKLGNFEAVLTTDIFDKTLDEIIKGKHGNVSSIYLDEDVEQKLFIKDEERINEKSFKDSLIKKYKLEIKDVYVLIANLRLIKSDAEVEEFKEAVNKTNIGLRKILAALKPNLYEYQLASLFYYTIQDLDQSELSFTTITATGVNAACLHYTSLQSKLKKEDLVLFDLGSKHNGYCADISRTYPVNGKFSSLQKKIYSIVLGCNKKIVSIIKPGMTLKQLNDETIKYLQEGCLKEGLIIDPNEIGKYYFHSVSHHIGLDTHDVSRLRELDKDTYLNRPLEKGNIISCEPGLYFEELGIGVRIEDDILVTKDGSLNLSSNIIKEIDEIEKAMNDR